MPDPGWDDVEALRAEIDGLDDRLLDLLVERARRVAALRRVKRTAGLPLLDPAREAEVLARAAARARPPLDADAARRVFEAVLAECRRIVTGDGPDPP